MFLQPVQPALQTLGSRGDCVVTSLRSPGSRGSLLTASIHLCFWGSSASPPQTRARGPHARCVSHRVRGGDGRHWLLGTYRQHTPSSKCSVPSFTLCLAFEKGLWSDGVWRGQSRQRWVVTDVQAAKNWALSYRKGTWVRARDRLWAWLLGLLRGWDGALDVGSGHRTVGTWVRSRAR